MDVTGKNTSAIKRVEPIVYVTRIAMIVCAALWFVVWVINVLFPQSGALRALISIQSTGTWLTLVPLIILSYLIKGKGPSVAYGICCIVFLILAINPFFYSWLFGIF